MEYINHLDEAKEEIKRADHLIYISLKYTKTVDVIKITIQRLINAFDFAILDVLEYAKKKKKIKSIPLSPIMRTEILKNLIKNEILDDFIDFYFLLKKIDKADFGKKEEYRKNVTLIAFTQPDHININIETLKAFFEKTKRFKEFIQIWEEEND